MLFRAPTRHRRKTNSICSVWQVATERGIGLTSVVSSWAASVTSLAPGIEVAQTFSKKPFRSTLGEVKSIPGKHSVLSKWSRQGRRAASSRLLIPRDKLESFLQEDFLYPTLTDFRTFPDIGKSDGAMLWGAVRATPELKDQPARLVIDETNFKKRDNSNPFGINPPALWFTKSESS